MATYKVKLAGVNRHESWVFTFDVKLDRPPVKMQKITIGSGKNAIVATATLVTPAYARVVSPEEPDRETVLRKLQSFREVSNILET